MSGTTSREAGVNEHNDPLRPDVATLPERLGAAGYHTYMSGKWNLGISLINHDKWLMRTRVNRE